MREWVCVCVGGERTTVGSVFCPLRWNLPAGEEKGGGGARREGMSKWGKRWTATCEQGKMEGGGGEAEGGGGG